MSNPKSKVDLLLSGYNPGGVADQSIAALLGDSSSKVYHQSRQGGAGAAMFGWISPRSSDSIPATSVPVFNWQNWGPFYPNDLPYDSPIVAHPAGRYVGNDWFGSTYLINTANAPVPPWGLEMVSEYATTSAEHAVHFWVPGGGSARMFVNGQEVPVVLPTEGGNYFVQILFPNAVLRTIRFETFNVFFGGINYPNGAEILAPQSRRTRAIMLGDSWVGGAADVPFNSLHSVLIGRSLNWDISRMGQGGSGYVTDNPSSESQPFTDPVRLQSIADQAPDYAIIQGSINDEDGGAVYSAATKVYSTLASSTPGTKLVVIGAQPTGPDPLTNEDKLRRAEISAALKAASIESTNVVRFHDPIEEDWLVGQPSSIWAGDQAHLSESGHAIWAKRFVQALTGP